MFPLLDRYAGGVLTLFSVAYVIAALESGYSKPAIFIFLALAIQAVCMVRNWRADFSHPCKVALLLTANYALFVFSRWAADKSGFHQFYLTLTALPFLMLDRRKRFVTGACVAIPVALYLYFAISIALPIVHEMNTVTAVLFWILLPFRFVFLLLGASYFAASGEKAQARISLTLSELRESVRTSRALLAAIPDMIFRVSDEGRFLDFHCQSERNLFAPPEDLVGKKLDEVLPAEISRSLFFRVRQAIDQSLSGTPSQMQAYSFEMKVAGSSRYFESRIAGTGASDALMVVQDVSERVIAEKTVLEQQLRGAATSKMASLGEMAAGIAHEINNPLAIISGRAQELQEMAEAGELDRDGVRSLAEKVDQTAMRISKIIRSLRFFARDGQEDPYEQVPVLQIVNDTLEFCRQRFLSHSIDLRVGEIPEDLLLECRPVQIGQVLLNLLNNAHDAVMDRAVMDRKERWIELSARKSPGSAGDVMEIAVTDSGCGIPAELRRRIFEPFFTTKGLGQGTGLGLSISKGIVESHRGRLFIDEQASCTRFVIKLPIDARNTGKLAQILDL